MTRNDRQTPRKPQAKSAQHESPWVYEALGRAVKTARTERGIERKELAAATGLSYAYLSDIESGRRRPSSKAIFAIAGALDMSPSELMRWTEELTRRIASEESLAEDTRGRTWVAPARPAAAPGAAAPAAPSAQRRSWFGGSPADAEATPAETEVQPADSQADLPMREPRGSARAELERVLDNLGPEDLELVLDLAQRLAHEQLPRR